MKAACGPRSMRVTRPAGRPGRRWPRTSTVRRALTRRRRISLRMALRCRAANSTVMARRHHQQRPQQRGMDGRRAEPHDARRLMQAVPLHRELDDGQDDDADEAQHGGQLGGQRLVLDRGAQRDQAEVEKEEDQHGGQPRVPHPEGAPHRLAPQRAGDEAEEREGGADGRGGLGRDVGERMAEHQQAEARDGDQRVAEHGKPRRRHVHEHDLGGVALLVVERRREGHVRGRRRAARRPAPAIHGSSRAGQLHEPGRIGEPLGQRRHGTDLVLCSRQCKPAFRPTAAGTAAPRPPPGAPGPGRQRDRAAG